MKRNSVLYTCKAEQTSSYERSYVLLACILEPSVIVHVVPLRDKCLKHFHKLIHSEKFAALQHSGNILLALAGGAGCRERSGVGLELSGEP